MKTSNILLLITLVAVLIGMTAFNLKLKCAYNKGDYKSAYYGMTLSPMNDVTHVNVQGANRFTITLRQGEEEGIWTKNDAKGNIEWHQEGNALTINLTSNAKASKMDYFYDEVILVLNHLDEVKTGAHFGPEEHVDVLQYPGGRISIEGFTQGNLDVLMSNRTAVVMDSLSIDTLNATIGEQDRGVATLTLGSGSKVKMAHFDLPGKSKLALENPTIDQVQYRLSSDASVSLQGMLVERLNN